VRKTAFKFIELIDVRQQLPDDQHGPAIGEDFCRTRHRTVLTVKVHLHVIARHPDTEVVQSLY
jgi:hypothetical protein